VSATSRQSTSRRYDHGSTQQSRALASSVHRWPEHDLLDLAPLRWAKTSARDDVRAMLDANPFRRLTLDARG
jgi:hypothetical protein